MRRSLAHTSSWSVVVHRATPAAQFSVDCHALLEGLPVSAGDPVHRLERPDCTIEFRLPTGADVAAASNQQRTRPSRDG